MTTTPTLIINLQIDGFHNCEGCILKVKNTLGKLGDGVRLLAIDPEMGKITVLTVIHPEVIRVALESKFSTKHVILLQQINLQNPLPDFSNPHNSIPTSLVTLQGTVNGHDDIAKALVTMSRAKGSESVEFTQSNTFKINFNINRENQPAASGVRIEDVGFGHVPPQPSAPPIPAAQAPVYGHPTAEFYGHIPGTWSINDHPKERCCNIL